MEGTRFKACGKTLEELFENAARLLTACLVETAGASATQTVFVQLAAETREELLAKWLEEILYHFQTEKLLGVDFNVTRCTPEDFRATLHAIKWNPARQLLKTEIKTTTFREMKIVKNKDQYEVEVILGL